MRECNFTFEELRVYQEALSFVDAVYDLVGLFPKEERFGLSDQMRRAATSIVLNIAEGSSRSAGDFGRFISMARGSVFECLAILTIAIRRKYISEENAATIQDQLDKLSRQLNALKKSIT